MSAPAKALAGLMGQGGSSSSSSAPQVGGFSSKGVAELSTGMQRSTSQGACRARALRQRQQQQQQQQQRIKLGV
jgi:hypothetical protein